MTATLEELLDVPEVRTLSARERETLVGGLKRLAAVDKPLAETFLFWLGREVIGKALLKRSHATIVGEYASRIGNLLDRPDYDRMAVGMPLVCDVAARQLPKTLGKRGLAFVNNYAQTLFDAAKLAQLLGQPATFFTEFLPQGYRIDENTAAIKHVTERFQALYTLDTEVARAAAAVVAKMPLESFDTYLTAISSATERLGSRNKAVRAMLNADRAEIIARKLIGFPQFPYVFGGSFNSSGVPISPSFYLVAGESFEDMRDAAEAQQALLHQNHFDLELAVIEESMPDIIRRIGLSGKGKIGLLDACTGNGAKFAKTLVCLASAMARSEVKNTVISGACLVDYNPYLIIEALQAIESLGIAVDGEATGVLPYRVSSKSRFAPEKAGKEIPVLKLTLPQGNVEDLVNEEGFRRFRQQFPTYLTTLLGTTVANFDPDTIARTLHAVTSEYCIVSVYLDEGNDAKLRSIYGSELVMDLSANNLRIAGISPQDFGKFAYAVDVQRWRYEGNGYVIDPLVAVVTYFEATEPVKGALFDFEKGERAPGLLSIKPTDAQFRTIMAANGLGTAAMYRLEDVALYLLRKKPLAATASSSQTHDNKELTRVSQ